MERLKYASNNIDTYDPHVIKTLNALGRDTYYEKVELRYQSRYYALKDEFVQLKQESAYRLEKMIEDHD